MTGAAVAVTTDAFLGGLVHAVQPARGHHRAGLEAVLLGASAPAGSAGRAVDLGAGAGVAGFCVAARCPGIEVALVEREAELVGAARAGLALPENAAFAGRVRAVALDVAAPESARTAAGLTRAAAGLVLCNPPFRDPGRSRGSPQPARAAAHMLEEGLDPWFRFAAWSLRPGGALVTVLAADLLGAALPAFEGRFGAAALLPVHPRPGRPAHRLLIRAVRGSRAGTSLLPGLVLHGDAGNAFAPPVAALLRGEAWLGDIHPAWQSAAAAPS